MARIDIWNSKLTNFGSLYKFDGENYVWTQGARAQHLIITFPERVISIPIRQIESFTRGLLSSEFEIPMRLVQSLGLEEFLVN